ncbi:MAG TPA: MFS transporter [Candidatus Latescibacteria bacterium]|nr:MFS transporter [Candidatus Latescibacterota bacterium]
MLSGRNREVWGWCLYDWANSAFATTVMAAVLPPYFQNVAASSLPDWRATALWGFAVSGATLAVALSAPLLGAVADQAGYRRRFFVVFWMLGVGATGVLALVGEGDWKLCLWLFVLGLAGFSWANLFYDSFLPIVATKEEVDWVSSTGYALGYLGGGLLLGLNLAMIQRPGWFGLPDGTWGARISFLTVAFWWAVFTAPFLLWVREPKGGGPVDWGAGVRELVRTLQQMRAYREAAKFLLAFWLYSDGINTVIKMAAIYGAEVGIETGHLVAALLFTQFVAFPFSLLFGKLSKSIGVKPAMYIALGVYTFVCGWGYFLREAWQFWTLAGLVGMVQGGAQALSRSLFARMVPKERTAEFFGFFSTVSKFSGILGPFLFGVAGTLFHTSRAAALVMAVLFLMGIAALGRVRVS